MDWTSAARVPYCIPVGNGGIVGISLLSLEIAWNSSPAASMTTSSVQRPSLDGEFKFQNRETGEQLWLIADFSYRYKVLQPTWNPQILFIYSYIVVSLFLFFYVTQASIRVLYVIQIKSSSLLLKLL